MMYHVQNDSSQVELDFHRRCTRYLVGTDLPYAEVGPRILNRLALHNPVTFVYL